MNDSPPSRIQTAWRMKATVALIAVNVAVFLAMVAEHPSQVAGFSTFTLVVSGGERSDLLRSGEWWRLVTSMFVHASPSHLIWNMAALGTVGRYLEPRYGWRRFLITYLFSGLVGSLATAGWLWNSPIVAIGASGAIMGVIGAGAVSAWRMGERGREFRNAMLFSALVTLVNGVIFHTNNPAHLGGMLGGALLVLIFGRRGQAAPDIEPLWSSTVAPSEATLVVRPPVTIPSVRTAWFCGTCGSPRALGDVSCRQCGTPFEETCSRCGSANPTNARFCGTCGSSLVTPPAAVPTDASSAGPG